VKEILDFKEGKKIIIFIDGDQLVFAQKDGIGKINYCNLLKFLVQKYCKDKEVYIHLFFSAGGEEDGREEDNKEDNNLISGNNKNTRRIDYLCNILGEILIGDAGVYFYKAYPLSKNNVDVNLSNEIYETLFDLNGKVQRIILISGDRDFTKPIRRAKMRGINILIIASKGSLSRYLKELADEIETLDDIIEANKELRYQGEGDS
jgi:uncharacterized LabA/DUF88 family protein